MLIVHNITEVSSLLNDIEAYKANTCNIHFRPTSSVFVKNLLGYIYNITAINKNAKIES